MVAAQPSTAPYPLCPTVQWALHSYKVNNTFPQVPVLHLKVHLAVHIHPISSKNSCSTHLQKIVSSFGGVATNNFSLIDSSLSCYFLNLLLPPKEMDRVQVLKVHSCCYFSPWAKDTSGLCLTQPVPGGLLGIFIGVLNHYTTAVCIVNGDSFKNWNPADIKHKYLLFVFPFPHTLPSPSLLFSQSESGRTGFEGTY